MDIFAKNLSRLNLLKAIIKDSDSIINISIYRNHSFEMISSVLNAFLDFSDLQAKFSFSDYDDSLNFQIREADIHIIWLDLDRYKSGNIKEFINERILLLRTKTTSPIIIATLGDLKLDLTLPTDCCYISVNDELNYLQNQLYDIAKEPYSGTKLSSKASLEIARLLGLKYIPAVMFTPYKAIVIDLDNTLYKGTLGEDGIENLIPNNELQALLKKLKNNGFFLCIASKNNEKDVKEMFNKRKDFILTFNDFTLSSINWDSKAKNIMDMSKKLNIGLDSMLFIDDNIAELENVSQTGINTILADENILNKVKYYPKLLKLKISKEDSIRNLDITANIERQKLVKQLSPKEYFEKLGINLIFHVNDIKQVPRITELLNKTNQFILNYARLNETEVLKYVMSSDKIIVTVEMSDKLSDSGIIAILLAQKIDSKINIEETTVSCRALGRNLEDIILPYAFKIICQNLECNNLINIYYKKGKRNTPALTWLEKLTNIQLKDNGSVLYNINKNIDTAGLSIEVKND